MNKVQSFLIDYIRKSASEQENAVTKLLLGKTNADVVRKMFKNYRGRGEKARGLRLSSFGLALMQPYFKCYEITLPEGKVLDGAELIYLEHASKLPYYIGEKNQLLMFDAELSIRIKLCDGDIKTLIDTDV